MSTVPVPSNVLRSPSPEVTEPSIERDARWTSNLSPEVRVLKLRFLGEV